VEKGEGKGKRKVELLHLHVSTADLQQRRPFAGVTDKEGRGKNCLEKREGRWSNDAISPIDVYDLLTSPC